MDSMQEGAFDQAVIDVDAIIHTASPVNLNTDDPQGDSLSLVATRSHTYT